MNQPRPLDAIVMAAGEGTRMKSAKPKVLHELCGTPMLIHILKALAELSLRRIIVVVRPDAQEVEDIVRAYLPAEVSVEFVTQVESRGTGDAVLSVLNAVTNDSDDCDLLVVLGDAPLLRSESLGTLVAEHRESKAVATLTATVLENPFGFGRVITNKDGNADLIVEELDATEEQRAIREVNTSVYCFRKNSLDPALRQVAPDNVKGEYYLTDVIGVLRDTGNPAGIFMLANPMEAFGVNDRAQLATADAAMRARINEQWMQAGVTIVDPATTYIDADVVLEADVRLLPGTALEGHTKIGAHSVIGPNARLTDSLVGNDVVIEHSVARESQIDDGATIGPFSYLRPGSVIGAGAHIGAHVEIKNSSIGAGTKIPHLSYIGDADVGENSNLGAGTTTANYDGHNKHRTIIGRDVRTGVNTVLVAPVTIGDGAYTGAGAVVTHDVPPGALAKGVPARIEEGWADRNG